MPRPEGPRVGAASWLLGRLPLAERMGWLAENGFDVVSFLDSELVSIAEDPRKSAAFVARELNAVDLQATVHASSGPSGSEERRRVFSQALATVAELQRLTGRLLCFSIDPSWHGGEKVVYDPDGTLRALQEAALALGKLGVALAVENWRINPDPAEFVRLASGVAPIKLGLLLDLGHLNMMSSDPVSAVSSVPLPICEVHVHDNGGDSDDHLPLGSGTLPLAGLVGAIRSRGEPLVWTLEIRAAKDQPLCPIDDPAARVVILKSLRSLSECLAAVKNPTARLEHES